jgi:hypothetical protein
MSDDPFAAFKEGQPPVEAPAKEKKPRKKKAAGNGATLKATAKMAEATPAPKKERKARKPRAAKEMRLPISMLLEIGSLSEEESGALLSIGAGLQKLPKKSRQKISAALSKIFG